jgi:hypothetical protein
MLRMHAGGAGGSRGELWRAMAAGGRSIMTKAKVLKTYPREGGLNCLPLLLFGLGIIRTFGSWSDLRLFLYFWPHRCIMHKA